MDSFSADVNLILFLKKTTTTSDIAFYKNVVTLYVPVDKCVSLWLFSDTYKGQHQQKTILI